MSSYANRQLWRAYETGRSAPVIQALERTGWPKPPAFRRREWENKAKPVALMRLNGRRPKARTQVVWRV